LPIRLRLKGRPVVSCRRTRKAALRAKCSTSGHTIGHALEARDRLHQIGSTERAVAWGHDCGPRNIAPFPPGKTGTVWDGGTHYELRSRLWQTAPHDVADREHRGKRLGVSDKKTRAGEWVHFILPRENRAKVEIQPADVPEAVVRLSRRRDSQTWARN